AVRLDPLQAHIWTTSLLSSVYDCAACGKVICMAWLLSCMPYVGVPPPCASVELDPAPPAPKTPAALAMLRRFLAPIHGAETKQRPDPSGNLALLTRVALAANSPRFDIERDGCLELQIYRGRAERRAATCDPHKPLQEATGRWGGGRHARCR